MNSNATKSVLFHRALVFGYTGPAKLPKDDGTLLDTNEWIGEAIQDCPDGASAINRLHDNLEQCFRRFGTKMAPNARALCIAGGGWAHKEEEVFPVRITISNFDRQPTDFEVQMSAPSPVNSLTYETYGVPFDDKAITDLERQFRRACSHGTRLAHTTLGILIWGFQRFAERHSSVSGDLLVTSLPRPPQQANSFIIAGGGPNSAAPTALYVPHRKPLGRAHQYFPTTVLPGMYVASMEVSAEPPPRL